MRPEANESYPRKNVAAVAFWLYSGDDYLPLEALAVSIVGSNTQMTLDAPLGGSVGDNDFQTVSFMYLVRLATDVITLTHNETVTMINFDVQMVRA